jgi:hypothetical protein
MREVRPSGGLRLFIPLPRKSSAMRTLVNISHTFSLVILAAVCFLGSSGCGGSEKVVSVAGTVTHNGQPVPDLVVSFVPQAATETGVSTGKTDANGAYKLTVVKSGSSGAVVGSHKVWVSRPREPFVEPGDKEAMDKQKKPASPATNSPTVDLEAILKKYGNLDKSPLTVEVKGGEAIDLKLD